MKVCINAGHCPGKDSGAVGKISKEVNLNRAIALEVCKQLDNLGIDVVFVQEQSLATVCRIANSEKADVFVSIHCNAAENKSANGTETFYWTSDTKSRTLANCVQNRLLDALRTRNRGLKDGTWLYVLKHTAMPAILTEVGFISNEKEERLINDNIKKIGGAIAKGILDYQRM